MHRRRRAPKIRKFIDENRQLLTHYKKHEVVGARIEEAVVRDIKVEI